jgi:hypothetical protein
VVEEELRGEEAVTEDQENEGARKVIQAIAAQLDESELDESELDAVQAFLGAYLRGKADGRLAAVCELAAPSAMSAAREVWGYASSDQCETWEGNCKTREEAIAEGREEFGGMDFWVMCGTRPDPAKYVPHIDTILDHMNEDAGEEGGEAAEDYPDVGIEGKEALGMLLRAWARQYARPTFWVANGIAERITAPKLSACPVCATMIVDDAACTTCGFTFPGDTNA